MRLFFGKYAREALSSEAGLHQFLGHSGQKCHRHLHCDALWLNCIPPVKTSPSASSVSVSSTSTSYSRTSTTSISTSGGINCKIKAEGFPEISRNEAIGFKFHSVPKLLQLLQFFQTSLIGRLGYQVMASYNFSTKILLISFLTILCASNDVSMHFSGFAEKRYSNVCNFNFPFHSLFTSWNIQIPTRLIRFYQFNFFRGNVIGATILR